MEKLKEACQDYFDYVNSDEFQEDEMDNYENAIFEAAMDHFYGDKFWNIINSKL